MFNYQVEQLTKPATWLVSNSVTCCLHGRPGDGTGMPHFPGLSPPIRAFMNNLAGAVFKDSQRDLGHCPPNNFFCFLIKKKTSREQPGRRRAKMAKAAESSGEPGTTWPRPLFAGLSDISISQDILVEGEFTIPMRSHIREFDSSTLNESVQNTIVSETS